MLGSIEANPFYRSGGQRSKEADRSTVLDTRIGPCSNLVMSTERGPIIPAGKEALYERFHFAPAYRVGDTIHVSGIIGTGPDGKVPESTDEEFAAAFAELAATLAASGSSVADIVEMTTFHMDIAETLGSFIAAKDAAITEPYPAWTAIGCSGLAFPGARAEVKVTAVVRDDA